MIVIKELKEKNYKIRFVKPETKKENEEIKKIIKEVETEKKSLNPDDWTVVRRQKEDML